ncbi:phage holin [Alkalibacter mobilis]|uniref:phage holin n=1 Tax=Alkalibacter mobilis TaxID=2787712 RepID=UPI0018A0875F|nr:phage holin [Alkalibacter mobilis]MBF7097569.1 phage holin [Alkalibacter mobilis]
MNLSGVTKEVWIRTIVLLVALFNQGLRVMGFDVLPFAEEEVADALSIIFMVIASLWAWWKNNSFTGKAQSADRILRSE